MHDSILNMNLLRHTQVKTEPFPYLILPHFIHPHYLTPLIESFPAIDHRGSMPASIVSAGSIFKHLIAELEGDALRHAIADKFALDLRDKPTLLTLRGQVDERDGHIHTDSKSKLITLLLYMNATWNTDTGKLRLLTANHSLEDYVEEISPLAGSCVIFKVTDNCWHGHNVFVGRRLSLQLNYTDGKFTLKKYLNDHRFSALLKQCFTSFKRTLQ
jgi:SM-20-related protein